MPWGGFFFGSGLSLAVVLEGFVDSVIYLLYVVCKVFNGCCVSRLDRDLGRVALRV